MAKKHTREEKTPSLRNVPGDPVTAWDMVNKYGTYNIQRTADTENTFPLISHALPTQWRGMHLDKYDLEKQE